MSSAAKNSDGLYSSWPSCYGVDESGRRHTPDLMTVKNWHRVSH